MSLIFISVKFYMYVMQEIELKTQEIIQLMLIMSLDIGQSSKIRNFNQGPFAKASDYH